MPPNTNDAPNQNQPLNTPPPVVPSVEPVASSPVSPTPVDDTVPPTVIPQQESAIGTTPVVSENKEASTPPTLQPEAPMQNATPELASPPPINEAIMPANNRPTLDTINTTSDNSSDSLEAEIDTLPETNQIENPNPEQSSPETTPITGPSLDAAATTEPAPTPPAFPETASAPAEEPKKKGFFSKFFKHK